MNTAEFWIKELALSPHPEGGFYKETYRSTEVCKSEHLPNRFGGNRCFSTAIYFLLRSEDKSVFHRIKSDELWHFYAGSSLTLFVIQNDKLSEHILGSPEKGQGTLQVVIPAGCWFGAVVNEPNSFVLAGCTVAPGFDFNDFEMAERKPLLSEYPQHAQLIERLTRD